MAGMMRDEERWVGAATGIVLRWGNQSTRQVCLCQKCFVSTLPSPAEDWLQPWDPLFSFCLATIMLQSQGHGSLNARAGHLLSLPHFPV